MKIPLFVQGSSIEFYQEAMKAIRGVNLPRNFNRRGFVSVIALLCDTGYARLQQLLDPELYLEFPEQGQYSSETFKILEEGGKSRDISDPTSILPWVLVVKSVSLLEPMVMSFWDYSNPEDEELEDDPEKDRRVNAPFSHSVQ